MTYALAALGGALIGLSAVLFLLLDGRIAGISGLVAGVLQRPSERWIINAMFVVGLSLGPLLFAAVDGGWPVAHPVASLPTLAFAGLLVGFGTRLGSGCTSGHGVCGLARLSPRSLVAVVTFLASGILTVLVERLIS
jgi:uncharacterized protein